MALRDMTQIVTYVAKSLESPLAADRLAERLVSAIESLSRLPTRCPPYVPPRPLEHEYRKHTVGSYLVFFYVSEEEELVTVARVLYGRRALEDLLE